MSILLALVLTACPKATPTPEEPRMTSKVVPEREISDMHVRLVHATQARDFVIKGQPSEAKAQLQWLLDNVPIEGPPAQVVHLQDVHEAASKGLAAQDSAGLAEAIADVGRACGACHETAGDGPQFQAVTEPETDAAMARHVWAADRMWEGLIGPDPERWRRSADLLKIEVVDFSALYAGVDLETAGDAARLHSRVHALADVGRMADDSADRVELYGAYIAACADCHALLGRGPR
jgi:cytochrome c553